MIVGQDEDANAYLGNCFSISMLRAVDFAPAGARVRATQLQLQRLRGMQ